MTRRTKIVNISLAPEVYRELNRLARQKKLSRSEVLRRALRGYIASEKIWQQIYQWGEASAQKLGIRNEDAVDRLIHQFRKGV